ncbi:hypothetical protein TcWFU_002213 [Taenia crassiceps]|uniref:Uncharacterized protein n=1 Tax=Taenia crassiceps TaxID=6207 RepID=A0ABR4Q9P6_9CEST
MQVPNRLSLVLPDFCSADNVSGTEIGGRALISGFNESNQVRNPYDLPVTRPSLEPPPESLILGQVDYPDIDRLRKPHYSSIGDGKENSNLSLFRDLYSPPDDDRTLVEQPDLNVSAGDCEASPAVNLEGQLEELVVRVAALEKTLARQNRCQLCVLILLGTYFLLKFGRSLL